MVTVFGRQRIDLFGHVMQWGWWSFAKVNLHEAFWTDDECLIVMDLAHGGNLFDKLHNDIVSNQADPFPGLGSSAGMWEACLMAA